MDDRDVSKMEPVSAASSGAAEPMRAGVQSLVELFEANASAHPQRPLFLSKVDGCWQPLTYGQMKDRIEVMRRSLSAFGFDVGDRIGIIAGNCVEWATLAYAAFGLGGAVVPMYENQLEQDWEFIVRDSEVCALFVANDEIRSKVVALTSTIPSLRRIVVMRSPSYEAFLRLGEGLLPVPSRASAEQTAAIMYTSGTTGQPKGVTLTHANLLSNVLPLRDVVFANENPEDHLTLSFLPWAHAFGQTVELHLLIAAGGTMAIAESVDKLADNMREVRPTVLVAVPRVFIRIYAGAQRLLEQKPRWVRRLFRAGIRNANERARGRRLAVLARLVLALADRLIFSKVRARLGGRLAFAVSGAAALPGEVSDFITALGIELYEGYGLTETSPIVSTNVPGDNRIGTVGRPLPGVRVEIDRSVGVDAHSGEIIVHGPNVMRGYHRRDEREAIFTQDGGFRTGDAGYLDAEGYLHITGRIKERYKLSNGKYVVPGPLESALKLSGFVSDAMVYGDGKPHNVALLVPDREALLSWASQNGLSGVGFDELCEHPEVKALLQSEVERTLQDQRAYERVRDFRILREEFSLASETLTPSLKLRRHKIVERYRAELDAMYDRPLAMADGLELVL
jgi:long-chain acyl-CoA synthetase